MMGIMAASENTGVLYPENTDNSFKIFYELMPNRVENILLVSSPYDAFIMDEDGRLAERIIHEYRGLNLTRPPRLTWVSTAQEALKTLSRKRFDLVISMPRTDGMSPYSLGRNIRETHPDLPLFLLAHDTSELITDHSAKDDQPFVQKFIWSGNTDLLLAMIKSVEDRQNAAHDTEEANVRIIIFIEDSPIYSASMLPLLYKEIVTQTQSVMDDSLNEEHRLLRMRARPKILMAKTYEEAVALYKQFSPYLLTILSDVRFPRNGEIDNQAGFSLLSDIKEKHPNLPLLIISSEESNREQAASVPAVFLNKNSPVLNTEVRSFLIDHLGFGDFFFRKPDGTVVGRASNLKAMETNLSTVPDESIYYHGIQNDFSSWLMARSEIHLASELLPMDVNDFDSIPDIRSYLIACVRKTRLSRQKGMITDFSPDDFDPDIDFAKLGTGSIGGKARGLAFIATLLKDNPDLHEQFPSVDIQIPKMLVIPTDEFDRFVRENILYDLSVDDMEDEKITEIFSAAPLSDGLRHDLALYLNRIGHPLAIRSSSLFEDARNQPCAGIYETYMLPNNQPDFDFRLEHLFQAIKLVYASTYLKKPRIFIQSTHHRSEDEKMAIIVQQLIGREEKGYFYPAVSGVAQSHNFYPISSMAPEEGIVHMALGFGRTVVEGETTLRFCPAHPELLPHFSGVDDILRNAQRSFYAMKMTDPANGPNPVAIHPLVKLEVDDVKDHSPIRYLASTYDPQDHRIRDFYQPTGSPVMTFASILKHASFPLPKMLSRILEIGRKGMASPVEIEFAFNLPGEGEINPELHLLQIRPMPMCQQNMEIEISNEEVRRAVIFSDTAMGNGRIEEVTDIVYVNPDTFDPAKTMDMASQIGIINGRMIKQNRKYLLIGPGRWGSADRWLGIPVTWYDISGVCAIIEATIEDLHADPSQGSHFFHNLTSSGISYISVTKDEKHFIDWKWLKSLSPAGETSFLKHTQFDPPLSLKIDGVRGAAVLLDQVQGRHPSYR